MDRYRIELVAFTPITARLFKTTLTMMSKRGYPVVLHDGAGAPDLYLLDTDNENTLDIWRKNHPVLDAPLVLIGTKTYDFFESPLVPKPLKWDYLVESIMRAVHQLPPVATLRWTFGYKEEPVPMLKPLKKLSRAMALVVDDNTAFAHYMGIKLSRFNIDIQQAQTIEQVFERVSNNTYVCIFLDASIPDIDVLEACRYLREYINIDTPLVMVAHHDAALDGMQAQAAGFSDVLLKPVDDASLHATMHRVLQCVDAM